MILKMIGWILGATAVIGFAGAPTGEVRADQFPSKTVTYIVPFSAGGGTDRWARAISSGALDIMGQPMRVRNMPGASGVVGWSKLLDRPADGYTLIQASPTPMLGLLQQQRPPFPPDKIKIVAYIGAFRSVVATQKGQPWTDWNSFVAYAKKNPGKVTVGGTNSNLVGVATTFKSAGIEVTMVPYGSTADGVADFLGGHIMAITGPASDIATFAPEKGLVIINASDLALPKKLAADFGNPPLATDIGLKGVSLPRWVGVHPDTPDEIVNILSQEMGELLAFKPVNRLITKMGEEIIFKPRAEAQPAYDELLAAMKEAIALLK